MTRQNPEVRAQLRLLKAQREAAREDKAAHIAAITVQQLGNVGMSVAQAAANPVAGMLLTAVVLASLEHRHKNWQSANIRKYDQLQKSHEAAMNRWETLPGEVQARTPRPTPPQDFGQWVARRSRPILALDEAQAITVGAAASVGLLGGVLRGMFGSNATTVQYDIPDVEVRSPVSGEAAGGFPFFPPLLQPRPRPSRGPSGGSNGNGVPGELVAPLAPGPGAPAIGAPAAAGMVPVVVQTPVGPAIAQVPAAVAAAAGLPVLTAVPAVRRGLTRGRRGPRIRQLQGERAGRRGPIRTTPLPRGEVSPEDILIETGRRGPPRLRVPPPLLRGPRVSVVPIPLERVALEGERAGIAQRLEALPVIGGAFRVGRELQERLTGGPRTARELTGAGPPPAPREVFTREEMTTEEKKLFGGS